jgi:hypothetical protein
MFKIRVKEHSTSYQELTSSIHRFRYLVSTIARNACTFQHSEGQGLLHLDCQNADLRKAKSLLDEGCDPNLDEQYGLKILHFLFKLDVVGNGHLCDLLKTTKNLVPPDTLSKISL